MMFGHTVSLGLLTVECLSGAFIETLFKRQEELEMNFENKVGLDPGKQQTFQRPGSHVLLHLGCFTTACNAGLN